MTDRIFVAVPAFGHIMSAHTMASVVDLIPPLMCKNAWGGLSTLTYPDIAELRNMFLTLWYDKIKSSHILFVDADMSFPFQLVLDMLALDKPVVGCLYPKKTLPLQFVGRPFKDDPDHQREECFSTLNGRFMRVEGIGFGVTLVRRDAITNMIDQGLATIEENAMTFAAEQMEKKFDVKHMIRAFDHVKVETGKLSEDYSFCWRHRQAGGEIWASVDYPITHVGQYGYTGCYGDLLYPKSMKTFPVAEMELA